MTNSSIGPHKWLIQVLKADNTAVSRNTHSCVWANISDPHSIYLSCEFTAVNNVLPNGSINECMKVIFHDLET